VSRHSTAPTEAEPLPTSTQLLDQIDATTEQQAQHLANAKNATDWQEQAAEKFAADKCGEQLEELRPAHKAAEKRERDEKDAEVMDAILPSIVPLDLEIIAAAEDVRSALNVLASASVARDGAVASADTAVRSILSERVTPASTWQPALIDQYPLRSTRTELVAELAAMLEPVFKSLQANGLADSMTATRRDASRRLIKPPEDQTGISP
jgi:hypothetical protein